MTLSFFFTDGVKYDLTDCVRYFDSAARYRLMSVGGAYFFVDAEKEYQQKPNVIQYYYDGETIYGISFVNERYLYFLLNTNTGYHEESYDKKLLSPKALEIFDGDKMIKLQKGHGDGSKVGQGDASVVLATQN